MQFPVILRYTPTKWAEAQYNRPVNSPSKFVTLSYQNKDLDSASPSPTRNASVPPHAQPICAVAPTARKRYLQSLSAESLEKPVHESLREMANYHHNAAIKPLSVVEAEWYLDVTNVAQRLKLLRETYKVIKSVRKKKLMGERADFRSLFDLQPSGNLSPNPIDDDKHSQLKSDDEDDPYTSLHRPPPIPNRRGRPRKKRGVDRKPPMSRSDHKRTRASLRRNITPDAPSSPAEKIFPASAVPEQSTEGRYSKSEKEDSSLSSQNERSATPKSPPPKPASHVSGVSTLPNTYEQKHNSGVPSSSPVPPVPSHGASMEGNATQNLQPESFALYTNENRNLIEKVSQSLEEDTTHGVRVSTMSPRSNVPMAMPVTEPLQFPNAAGNRMLNSANNKMPLVNNDTKRGVAHRARTSSSASEILNDIYSRAEHASITASSYGNVTESVNRRKDDHVKGYSELLQELDQHRLTDSGSAQNVAPYNRQPHPAAPVAYSGPLPSIRPVKPNSLVVFPKQKDSYRRPPA